MNSLECREPTQSDYVFVGTPFPLEGRKGQEALDLFHTFQSMVNWLDEFDPESKEYEVIRDTSWSIYKKLLGLTHIDMSAVSSYGQRIGLAVENVQYRGQEIQAIVAVAHNYDGIRAEVSGGQGADAVTHALQTYAEGTVIDRFIRPVIVPRSKGIFSTLLARLGIGKRVEVLDDEGLERLAGYTALRKAESLAQQSVENIPYDEDNPKGFGWTENGFDPQLASLNAGEYCREQSMRSLFRFEDKKTGEIHILINDGSMEMKSKIRGMVDCRRYTMYRFFSSNPGLPPRWVTRVPVEWHNDYV